MLSRMRFFLTILKHLKQCGTLSAWLENKLDPILHFTVSRFDMILPHARLKQGSKKIGQSFDKIRLKPYLNYFVLRKYNQY